MTKLGITTKVTVLLFLLLTGWWLLLRLTPIGEDSFQNELFSASYGVMALWGGLLGWRISKKWGGVKSILGRSIVFFALGLLAQEFGQLIYSFYSLYLGVEIPYPSLGDLGFFGSIPLYIYAVWLLSRASGVSFTLKDGWNKLIAILVPAGMLYLSYYMFLSGYEFDFSSPLTIALDFGYPFGQAIYISVALLTYLLSKKLLGGLMKNRILFVLFALLIQYLADFTFLYMVSRDIWDTAGINEFMYLLSYFVMTLALISLNNAFNKIKNASL